MKSLIFTLLFVLGAAPMAAADTAHDFSFTSIEGNPMAMSDFAGKAVLVVNTASRCGYTPQYRGLQSLWEAYEEKGLVVLGVPSNDFGGQEPGTEAQIQEFCEVEFGVNFPMTEKYEVKGSDAHPFYQWAANLEGEPRWNFHKYLIAPDGKMVESFPSGDDPMGSKIRTAVDQLLEK